MTEEEWVKGILTEPTKWNLTKEQADRLFELNIEPDYGSFSAKVIKQILPLMREGKNEYQALSECESEYMKSDDEKSKDIQLNEKITQLKYQQPKV